ncbi:MAG: hypothetical protein LBF72_01435 [Holosporales bacterium]|jgi:hypothetical protein|nr:hypothetical protein [Holosporales bacterium]
MQAKAEASSAAIVVGQDGEIAKKMRADDFYELTYLGPGVIIDLLVFDTNECLPLLGDLQSSFNTEVGKIDDCDRNYDEYGKRVREWFTSLKPTAQKQICKAFSVGNCGGLANYFLRADFTALRNSSKHVYPGEDIIDKIAKKFTKKDFIIFRISLKSSHTFICIKIGDTVEILQAWQGEYSVRDWLNQARNCFSWADFICLLKQITTNVEMANEFYSVLNGKIELTSDKIGIDFVGFKTFNSKEELEKHIVTVPVADKTILYADQYLKG